MELVLAQDDESYTFLQSRRERDHLRERMHLPSAQAATTVEHQVALSMVEDDGATIYEGIEVTSPLLLAFFAPV